MERDEKIWAQLGKICRGWRHLMRNPISNAQGPVLKDRLGAYQLAIRAPKTEIDPGDDIILEIYVTGYGEIRGAKVVFYPPPSFVRFTHVEGWAAINAAMFGRGGTNHAVIIPLGTDDKVAPYEWHSDTDPHGIDISAIQAEAEFNPPIKLTLGTELRPVEGPPEAPPTREEKSRTLRAALQELKRHRRGSISAIEKPIPPGHHSFQVFLTYFNGSEWKTDTQSVTVSVRNWFQRNYYATWVAGILGVSLTLISLVVNVIANLGGLWDFVCTIFHALT